MGRNALVITDDMVDELQDILISAGIDIEKKMHSDIDSSLNLPPFSLHCRNELGERVDLGFGRSNSPPYELIIKISPVFKSFWESFKRTKLRSQIIELLMKHGATDVGKVSEGEDKDKDQNTGQQK